MKRTIIAVIVCAALVSSASAALFQPMKPLPMPRGIGVFFAQDQIEDRVIELIETAEREILVNQYAITSPRIAAALVNAYQKKHVLVSIILEAAPAIRNYETPDYFLVNEIPVMLRKGDGYNNNKYMVIDRQAVVTGSYDFTNAAASKNDENLIVINETAVAVAYYNNWVSMARRCVVPTSSEKQP